jgi:hypothetical protein
VVWMEEGGFRAVRSALCALVVMESAIQRSWRVGRCSAVDCTGSMRWRRLYWRSLSSKSFRPVTSRSGAVVMAMRWQMSSPNDNDLSADDPGYAVA